MFLTIVCWDTHTGQQHMFHAPRSTREAAISWLESHLIDKFMAEGLELIFAEDRARDFEVTYVFKGKLLPVD